MITVFLERIPPVEVDAKYNCPSHHKELFHLWIKCCLNMPY